MLEIQKEDMTSYFDENSLIEDEFYKSYQNLIKCKYCNKILKDPMMCQKCETGFCKNCIDELDQDNHKCEKPVYVQNLNAKYLLGKLTYLCKNCKAEIKGADIENHLKEGCVKNENPTKFMNAIYRKEALRKLNQSEITELNNIKNKVNHISGKILIYLYLFYSIIIRSIWCRKIIFG